MSSRTDFALEISELHWLEGGPEEADLCAHGGALVRLGDEILVSPSDGDSWTLSAASLYLLRSLFRDHTPDSRLGDHLIPCCGFAMWPGDDNTVVIVGCPSGIDWSVRHRASGVKLESAGGGSVVVEPEEWCEAVLRVADRVRSFYNESAAKRLPEDYEERRGYEVFWAEWERHRAAVA